MKRKRSTSKPSASPAKTSSATREAAGRRAIDTAIADLVDHHGKDDLIGHASPLSLVHPEPVTPSAPAPVLPTAPRTGRAKADPKAETATPRPASAKKQTKRPAAQARTEADRPVAAGSDQERHIAHRPEGPAAADPGRAENDNTQVVAGAQPVATAEDATTSRPETAESAAPVVPPRVAPPEPAATGSAATGSDRSSTAPAAAAAARADPMNFPDLEMLTRNMGSFIEHSGKAAAAYLRPREQGAAPPPSGEDFVQTLNSLGRVAESWITNPTRMIQAQAALSTQLFALWNHSLASFGAKSEPQPPRVGDKRFAAQEWRETPFFDFLHQAYLVTTDWAKAMVADADGVDEATREKAGFYLRQISSALSPSNFLATNPELIKETFREKGENLVRGMQMLAEDIAAGNGELKIRQSDATQFTLGVDMAATPGKVVYRNDLMELIQYAPSTAEVLRRPLLIVPPWINKFYVLDLNPEKSFIRWAVAQGLTVFVISWVNPDERHARKDWDAYMREGIFAALEAVTAATGERQVATVGYCVGGTLLAATLAAMAASGDDRVSSSTFLTTQVDFKEAGDLKVFADEAQIRAVERQMQESGYLAGSRMANAFNMLRPDDLIWASSVNAYIKGKAPKPFDLLAWNADSTRMSAANHAFYLRNCYLENNLTRGQMVLGGQKLDLRRVTIPIYDLAAKEDHIAPARSVFTGSKFFGGPVRYVMAGSGHIAGVVNPPSKPKYQYWTGGQTGGSFEHWVETATETPGTWWLDWIEWIKAQSPETTAARTPGDGGLHPICDAPGDYVRVQS